MTRWIDRAAGTFAAFALVAFMVTIHRVESGRANAQQIPSIASATLSASSATIGDRLTMTVTVDHGDSFTVEGPGFGDDFGEFELLTIDEPRRETNGNASSTTLAYTFTTFTLGTVALPPLSIAWRGPIGEGTLLTEAQPVTVRSVLAPGETDLRPGKPQLDIAADAPSPIWPTAFVAIFAALTAAGYWLVQRAIAQRPLAPGSVVLAPLTAAEAARAALDRLAAEEPRREPREFYAAVAYTVRKYLSERYGFPAYAMTRRELQRYTSRAGVDRWPARLTANLLEQCDAVQFAGFRPAPERIEADLTAAYEIIALTSEEPASLAEPEAAPGTS